MSRPFDRPETGKITVKVINHYGDEVLKGFGVGENLPWDGRQLIAGTGMYGRLLMMRIDRADFQ